MKQSADIAKTLRHGLRPIESRVLDSFYADLENSYRQWPGTETDAPPWVEPFELIYRLKEFLDGHIEEMVRNLATLRRRYNEYSQRYAHAASEEDRHEQIVDFARVLGATRRDLVEDRRAFGRWFDHDAVVDRYRRRYAKLERDMALCLERLGVMCGLVLDAATPTQGAEITWRRLALERALRPFLSHDGDSRVRIAAFRCLATALRTLPAGQQQGYVSDVTLQYLYRSALDPRQPVWIQCEALVLLRDLSPDTLETALRKRLGSESAGKDDIFVRRRATQVLTTSVESLPQLGDMLAIVLNDPSAYVRQGLAEMLAKLPAVHALRLVRRLAHDDQSPQVRAAAINSLPKLAANPVLFVHTISCLQHALEQESDRFVTRVALRTGHIGHSQLLAAGEDARASEWLGRLSPAIAMLHTGATETRVRRWAGQTQERLWVQADPLRRQLYAQLVDRLGGQTPSNARYIRRRDLAITDSETVGRVLAVIAQSEHGWGMEPGRWRYRFQGETRRFRMWRLLHEIKHPSTDKRQAFRHTIGRVFRGTIRAPSAIMAELSETKVPGEPLYIPTEDSWRPYLPLVDELVSALDHGGKTLRLYSAEGITQIRAPRLPHRWLRARTVLSSQFARFAELRNWQEDSQIGADSYLREVRKLGFEIRFLPHEYDAVPVEGDPNVARFFSITPLLGITVSWGQVKEYFFSIYENNLYDLGWFILVMSMLFGGRHLYLNRRFRYHRRRIPLVVGGWGTRGKSGTERLKAALFNALGYSIISKTTGCEAMFLMAYPFDQVREMFLFRPYDKATIWEQTNILEMASKLGAEVFLWECMGLQPVYVGILQRQWMRDDVSTITNTYPDHEDVQGPAGIDVAETMTHFIPRGSTLLTSEEQMLPVLRTACNQLDTRMREVGWFEAGMLTSDVMERFPYEEHPYNVALILALADELGIESDFALKEIADRVVPDLGVLKTYPTSHVRGRKLEFIMGMSANERLGCLTNWKRMQMDTQDAYETPGVWVTTVVNNRADRVPRSRVFADIIAADVSADRHFLIGTNLKGLFGYIHEAWQSHASQLTLWPEKQDEKASPAAVFETAAHRMRVPLTQSHVSARLHAMLQGLGVDTERVSSVDTTADPENLERQCVELGVEAYADDLLQQLKILQQTLNEYQSFASRLADDPSGDRSRIDQEFRDLMWRWLESKLVVIEDPHTPGEQIIDRICRETPPGVHNRIMGMQNIKGTGLDFVYRWEAWFACYNACQQLHDPDPSVFNEGLRFLVGFREYGVLSEKCVRTTIDHLEAHASGHSERFRAELSMILENLEQCMGDLQGKGSSDGSPSVITHIANYVETFLDVGDAVKRRKIANQIYRDLAKERIGQQRAVLELQKLNKRQKGGWLAQRLSELLNQLHWKPSVAKIKAKA